MKRLSKNTQSSLDKMDESTVPVLDREMRKARSQLELVAERKKQLEEKLKEDLKELNKLESDWNQVLRVGNQNKEVVLKLCELGNLDPMTATKRQLMKVEDEHWRN